MLSNLDSKFSFTKRERVFCAFCRSERKVYRKKRSGIKDAAAAFLCALLAMVIFYRQWDPRVFLFFVFFLAVGDFLIQIRWRLGLVCPQCGFDPVIYQKSPEKAAAQVIDRLERRKQDLLSMPLDLPRRKRPLEDVERKAKLDSYPVDVFERRGVSPRETLHRDDEGSHPELHQP